MARQILKGVIVSAAATSRRAPNLLARSSFSTASDHYTVAITGSSGTVGKSVLSELDRRGTVLGKPVRVVRLLRHDSTEAKDLGKEPSTTTLKWNPNGSSADSVIDPAAASEINAIIHLGGENVSTGLGPLGFLGIRPWTDAKKREILGSRVVTTKALSRVVAESKEPKTFLVASGVGVYGDNFVDDSMAPADETRDVSSTEGFLAHVSREWEAATNQAKSASNQSRVVNMRFGVVMSKHGGALQKLYPVFFLGGGGIIGNGKQYFTFISARDKARAILHCLETPQLAGPVNVCAPEPCTNARFTKALGEVMKRPTILPFPGFAVSLLFGEMGESMLLGGVRATPKKLTETGFEFLHPTIKDALQSAMDEDI